MNESLRDDALVPLHIEQIWIYPVKSCAGVRVRQAELLETGLEWDRTWMVVDETGEFVSQRELPRMALIQPAFRMGQLELRAPGMLSLHLALDAAETPCQVRVWDDRLQAYDMGEVAAQWLSDFLGPFAPPGMQRLRLVRFDPEVRRLSPYQWTGGLEALNQFSDGYPLLVLSSAALRELNERLAVLEQGVVGAERFRPNLVLGGLEAHDEDRMTSLHFQADEAAGSHGVLLQPVKPCSRCSIPDVDPLTAATSPVVGDMLRTYRQDNRLMGAITFGMNAIVRAGFGTVLREGMPGAGVWGPWQA